MNLQDLSTYTAATEILLDKAMPCERQSAEWGVNGMKYPFKRLSVPLPADVNSRFRILQICAHLLNFRSRFVGLNQIRSVYKDEGAHVQPWLREFSPDFDVDEQNKLYFLAFD